MFEVMKDVAVSRGLFVIVEMALTYFVHEP